MKKLSALAAGVVLIVGLLIKQFTELEERSADLRRGIAERNLRNAQLLDEQFAVLSAALFPDRISPDESGRRVHAAQ